MDEQLSLLDTPKKSFLQQQSLDIRIALKDFERTFAAEHGRKPRQADIKIDAKIAHKYKEYQKIQDVLAGRISYEDFSSARSTNNLKTRKHARTDSGLGSSPQKHDRVVHATPKKSQRFDETGLSSDLLDPSDAQLPNMIGPTPHRDGQVLGLFDLMPGPWSAGKMAGTPSSSARKRKIEELYEITPAKKYPLQVIQTPSCKSRGRKDGDLLDFLAGTPQRSTGQTNRKLSRTPQSQGKKFELSQFFATPSTHRFFSTDVSAVTNSAQDSLADEVRPTPPRQIDTTGLDTTPAYLRRSTSFKDRLLSASQDPSALLASSSSGRSGPPTLQHFRSSTSNVLKATEVQSAKTLDDADHYDDDLEALRELEDDGPETPDFVENSQRDLPHSGQHEIDAQVPLRQYKKKGQKRTTRKANIKPTTQKSTAQPRFVAPDESEVEEETDAAIEKASKLRAVRHDFDESDLDDLYESDSSPGLAKKKKDLDTLRKSDANNKAKKAGTINPNAQSHMNFRSLKIKNKNSKAKGAGRSHFRRARR